MTKDLVDAKAVRKLIKNIDTIKGKGRGETLDMKDPKFMDKIMKQMKLGKKSGGVMKMRGGGMATQGTKFSIR
jgi:hypothetical protein|tara:strand:- start:701 stop:919 length:219 start_codon:yes stop_codon:yes gene_type:complete